MSGNSERTHLVSFLGGGFVAADFDNDKKPDGAVLLEAGQLNGRQAYRIELHLTARSNSTIKVPLADTPLTISTIDLNRDGAPDIVVQRRFPNERLQVYLNDGHGSFKNAPSEGLTAPDGSGPLLCVRVYAQDPFPLFMSSTGSIELAQAVSLPREHLAIPMSFWPEILIARSGARAPWASRAPPSLLSL